MQLNDANAVACQRERCMLQNGLYNLVHSRCRENGTVKLPECAEHMKLLSEAPCHELEGCTERTEFALVADIYGNLKIALCQSMRTVNELGQRLHLMMKLA